MRNTTYARVAAIFARQTTLSIDDIEHIVRRIHAAAAMIRDRRTTPNSARNAIVRARSAIKRTGWTFDARTNPSEPAITRGSERLTLR